jgi:DNA mismatch endonuclease, patch repair protein
MRKNENGPREMVDRTAVLDAFDPARSALMGRIRNKNSKPEMVVRRAVHALGYRFRLHQRNLPGTPDLVFPRLRKAIYVHGCFWHRHPGCYRTTTPKTRATYWAAKFEANMERDMRKEGQLKALGWKVLVIWECETFDSAMMVHRVDAFLAG